MLFCGCDDEHETYVAEDAFLWCVNKCQVPGRRILSLHGFEEEEEEEGEEEEEEEEVPSTFTSPMAAAQKSDVRVPHRTVLQKTNPPFRSIRCRSAQGFLVEDGVLTFSPKVVEHRIKFI